MGITALFKNKEPEALYSLDVKEDITPYELFIILKPLVSGKIRIEKFLTKDEIKIISRHIKRDL